MNRMLMIGAQLRGYYPTSTIMWWITRVSGSIGHDYASHLQGCDYFNYLIIDVWCTIVLVLVMEYVNDLHISVEILQGPML